MNHLFFSVISSVWKSSLLMHTSKTQAQCSCNQFFFFSLNLSLNEHQGSLRTCLEVSSLSGWWWSFQGILVWQLSDRACCLMSHISQSTGCVTAGLGGRGGDKSAQIRACPQRRRMLKELVELYVWVEGNSGKQKPSPCLFKVGCRCHYKGRARNNGLKPHWKRGTSYESNDNWNPHKHLKECCNAKAVEKQQ